MNYKIKAALIHLLGSALLILGTTGYFLFHYYPGMLAELMDVTDLLKILVPVDIVLGPILTFLIYKPGKRGLKLDITIIIFCQLAALAYGNWNLLKSRPGFLVYYYDAFYIAPPHIPQQEIDLTLQVGPFDSPKTVWADMGDLSFEEKMKIAQEAMGAGLPVQFKGRFFRPLDTIESNQLDERSVKVSAIAKLGLNPALLEQLETLKAAGHTLGYFPLVFGQSSKIIVMDTSKKLLLMTFDIPKKIKAKPAAAK